MAPLLTSKGQSPHIQTAEWAGWLNISLEIVYSPCIAQHPGNRHIKIKAFAGNCRRQIAFTLPFFFHFIISAARMKFTTMKHSYLPTSLISAFAFSSIVSANPDLGYASPQQTLHGEDEMRSAIVGGLNGITETQVNSTFDFLDQNLLCDKSTNVTLSTTQGNVTFVDGRLTASPDAEPVIWTLDLNDRQSGYGISTTNPFGKRYYWQSNSGRQEVSTDRFSEVKVQIAVGNPSKLVFGNDNRCLYFNDKGEAIMEYESACQPLLFKKVNGPTWENPPDIADTCARNIVNKIENAGGVHAAKMDLADQAIVWVANKVRDFVNSF